MRIAKYPKSLTISLSSEQYQWLKVTSDEKRMSIGELLREIVQQHQESQRRS